MYRGAGRTLGRNRRHRSLPCLQLCTFPRLEVRFWPQGASSPGVVPKRRFWVEIAEVGQLLSRFPCRGPAAGRVALLAPAVGSCPGSAVPCAPPGVPSAQVCTKPFGAAAGRVLEGLVPCVGRAQGWLQPRYKIAVLGRRLWRNYRCSRMPVGGAFSAVSIHLDAPGSASLPFAASWNASGRRHPPNAARGHSACWL